MTNEGMDFPTSKQAKSVVQVKDSEARLMKAQRLILGFKKTTEAKQLATGTYLDLKWSSCLW